MAQQRVERVFASAGEFDERPERVVRGELNYSPRRIRGERVCRDEGIRALESRITTDAVTDGHNRERDRKQPRRNGRRGQREQEE